MNSSVPRSAHPRHTLAHTPSDLRAAHVPHTLAQVTCIPFRGYTAQTDGTHTQFRITELRIVEESMNHGNGQAMDLGSGASYGPGSGARDGSRPASAAWMFAGEPLWRI